MLEKKYNHLEVEKDKYNNWKEKGYFESGDLSKKPYCIVIPPPNVTGKLHLGHAWDTTLQDIMIRFKKMDGYDTLWLPGMDHAAIATEARVVARLKDNGINKYELGREGFLDECWKWTHEYSENIRNQWAKLGLTLDYRKEAFTLDENLSYAVKYVFKKLYDEGLIYRGERIINWDPVAKTALSNEEVIYKDDEGAFYHLKYFIEGSDEYLEVATTRPETLFGDTAVAVNPEDKRYKHLIGKNVVLPVLGKLIPVVGDEHADMEFGTGVVKITPAHDPNDFEVGNRHNLERVVVMNEDATMNENAGKYVGMTREECREALIKDLTESGLLIKIEKMTHNVGHSERTDAVVEPYLSKQWFVKMRPLADRVLDNQKNKDTKVNFVPDRFEKTMNHWIEITYDWCISRQLWWGHRIPAWYKGDEVYVGEVAPESSEWIQDEDVLDTWFSSALWAFATLGWPENTEDLKTFYPTNTLVTGYDIITFWVSRMVTAGLYQLNEIPFKDVVIHGLVRDSQGRKMSKTLGNGVDPMEVIKEYGADALRFSVISGTTIGNDIKYMPEKLDQASNFANKIWNAAKFIKLNLVEEKDIIEYGKKVYNAETKEYNRDLLKLEDKWILNKLDKLVNDVTNNINNYELGIALDNIYSFIWNEFCDWYIEIVKSRIYSESYEEKVLVGMVLNYVFTIALKLLHPFMPFVTSEIYESLIKFDDKELMMSKWPSLRKELAFNKEEKMVENLKDIIVGIRNVRANMNIHPTKKADLIFVTKEYKNEIEDSKDFILKLGFGKDLKVQCNKSGIATNAISIMANGIEVYMPFEDLVDIKEEIERLEKEKIKLESEVLRGEKMLSNPGFVNKAPEAKINEEKVKLENYKQMLETVKERLNSMK